MTSFFLCAAFGLCFAVLTSASPTGHLFRALKQENGDLMAKQAFMKEFAASNSLKKVHKNEHLSSTDMVKLLKGAVKNIKAADRKVVRNKVHSRKLNSDLLKLFVENSRRNSNKKVNSLNRKANSKNSAFLSIFKALNNRKESNVRSLKPKNFASGNTERKSAKAFAELLAALQKKPTEKK